MLLVFFKQRQPTRLHLFSNQNVIVFAIFPDSAHITASDLEHSVVICRFGIRSPAAQSPHFHLAILIFASF
jgi:hypothetical protein